MGIVITTGQFELKLVAALELGSRGREEGWEGSIGGGIGSGAKGAGVSDTLITDEYEPTAA